MFFNAATWSLQLRPQGALWAFCGCSTAANHGTAILTRFYGAREAFAYAKQFRRARATLSKENPYVRVQPCTAPTMLLDIRFKASSNQRGPSSYNLAFKFVRSTIQVAKHVLRAMKPSRNQSKCGFDRNRKIDGIFGILVEVTRFATALPSVYNAALLRSIERSPVPRASFRNVLFHVEKCTSVKKMSR